MLRLNTRRASAVTVAAIIAILVSSFMPWPPLIKMAVNIIGLVLASVVLLRSRRTPVSSAKTK